MMKPEADVVEPRISEPAIDRAFYFIIVLWGKRFRDYFLDLCLPALLSPGNLPALATAQRSKFLIWTRPDDWAVMRDSPIFRLLEQYVDPVFNEIAPCPPGVFACVHMGAGHRRGLEMAYQAKAYPFVLQPDSIFSDGTIRRLQELAREGVQLALVPALRFAEEPFFENLEKVGISPRGRSGVAEPIKLSGRQLAHVALNSLHSETMTYEWDAPYFFSSPSAVWWRVPDQDGIIVHSFSWAPLLFDFTAVPMHDTSTFDGWTIDGDYVHRNLGDIEKIHLVVDSDEIFIASWAPSADKPYPLTPQPALQRRLMGDLIKKARFRNWFYSGHLDHFKREIFFHGARWHSLPVNDRWPLVERRALTTLLSCVAPPPGSRRTYSALRGPLELNAMTATHQAFGIGVVLFTAMVRIWSVITRTVTPFANVVRTSCANYRTIIRRFGQIARGDPIAIRRVKWRVRGIVHELLRRPFKKSEPISPD